jgi:hypothetical protein
MRKVKDIISGIISGEGVMNSVDGTSNAFGDL